MTLTTRGRTDLLLSNKCLLADAKVPDSITPGWRGHANGHVVGTLSLPHKIQHGRYHLHSTTEHSLRCISVCPSLASLGTSLPTETALQTCGMKKIGTRLDDAWFYRFVKFLHVCDCGHRAVQHHRGISSSVRSWIIIILCICGTHHTPQLDERVLFQVRLCWCVMWWPPPIASYMRSVCVFAFAIFIICWCREPIEMGSICCWLSGYTRLVAFGLLYTLFVCWLNRTSNQTYPFSLPSRWWRWGRGGRQGFKRRIVDIEKRMNAGSMFTRDESIRNTSSTPPSCRRRPNPDVCSGSVYMYVFVYVCGSYIDHLSNEDIAARGIGKRLSMSL